MSTPDEIKASMHALEKEMYRLFPESVQDAKLELEGHDEIEHRLLGLKCQKPSALGEEMYRDDMEKTMMEGMKKIVVKGMNVSVIEDDMEKALEGVKKIVAGKADRVQKRLSLTEELPGLPRLPVVPPVPDYKVSLKDHMPPSDMTPLMAASYYGHEGIIKILVQNGGQVNDASKDGVTALMLAAYMGWKKVVEILVEHGADVNQKDLRGNNALMYAVIGMSDVKQAVMGD